MELELYAVEKVDHLVYPDEFDDISLKSPAITVFTDFRHHQPNIIDAGVSAVEAERMMLRAHVKLKLVVDKSREFVGTVSLDDLSQQNILQQKKVGIDREDVRVADLMCSRLLIKAISYSRLRRATVADVLETLRSNGRQHCLVVDNKQHHIRGLISASDVARRLHIPLNISSSPSFHDIFCYLADPS